MTARTVSPQEYEGLSAYEYVLYAAVVFSWSASWYALSLQVGTVAVQTSLFWRFVIAAAVMFGWALLAGKQMRFAATRHLQFAALGLCIFCLNFMLFYYGSAYLISGLLSVVFSLASVFSLAITFLVFGTVPRRRVVFGALLGLLGIAMMFWPEVGGQEWNGAAAFGLALCVGGTLCFCVGSQISAVLQRAAIPVISASAWGMAYGATASGLMSLAGGRSLALNLEPVYLASLIFLALISSVMAFWAYLTLLGRIGAGRAGYATVMFPVFALLISTIVEGYVFTAVALAGLVLVLVGNVLVLGGGKRP